MRLFHKNYFLENRSQCSESSHHNNHLKINISKKRGNTEYIGETGRQLKIRMEEHETDSKVDFRKKSGKKKKDKLSNLSEHLKNIN